MPRADSGPRFRLFGPDEKYGAIKRPGFKAYKWYILYRDSGQSRQWATGLGHTATAEEKNHALVGFLANQEREIDATADARSPNRVSIYDVLLMYGEGHGLQVGDTVRLGQRLSALMKWWKHRPLSDVTASTCRAYVAARREGEAARRTAHRLEAEARAKEARRVLPPRPDRPITNGTARSELATLNAAIQWCHAEGKITSAPVVLLPERSDSRERWLTRKEVADMLRAIRRLGLSHYHLRLFVLLGVYSGARKEAILSLQWQPNQDGGYIDMQAGVIDFRGGENTTRSKKKRTRIPIPPRLMTFLRIARKKTNRYVIEYEGDRLGDIKRGFAGVVEASGLHSGNSPTATRETVVTPHTLRHTCVTWLVQRGIPLWEIGKWVGMSTDMIERVYGHHAPEHFDRVLNDRRNG